MASRPSDARHANRRTIAVDDGYDVQDLLAAMPAADFDDVRDEEFSPSVAAQNSRIDFVLVGPGIAVETKTVAGEFTCAKCAATTRRSRSPHHCSTGGRGAPACSAYASQPPRVPTASTGRISRSCRRGAVRAHTRACRCKSRAAAD
ncbi:hypothetical protein [Paraburkholderia sacchari]|uniref:PD-(D/E)XK nuclease domain-containing protein n=1 Tax=Paraburkholderia sacchari TaxID=159450 RepID=UPI0039A64730